VHEIGREDLPLKRRAWPRPGEGGAGVVFIVNSRRRAFSARRIWRDPRIGGVSALERNVRHGVL